MSSTASITLYDMTSTLPDQTFSSNVAKVRYALNIKGIPYKTFWLEAPEIAAMCKKIGAKPTSETAPQYTVPFIHDPSTGAIVSNSIDIVEYLDATYPDTPRLIPAGTYALQRVFTDALFAVIRVLFAYTFPATLAILNPISREYIERTRGAATTPDPAAWKAVKDGLDHIDGWIRKNGVMSEYIMGDTISYADLETAAWLRWVRVTAAVDQDKWEEVMSWNGGRWARLVAKMEKYETVV